MCKLIHRIHKFTNSKRGQIGKISCGILGRGNGQAEPGVMPLMPPFHDTRFWYLALIGQMSSCWQIRGAVDSIALFQYHAPTIRENIFWNTDFEQAIQISLRDFSLIPRLQEERKICLWSVAKTTRSIQTTVTFIKRLTVNRRSKGTVL